MNCGKQLSDAERSCTYCGGSQLDTFIQTEVVSTQDKISPTTRFLNKEKYKIVFGLIILIIISIPLIIINTQENKAENSQQSLSKICDWDVNNEIIQYAADKGKLSVPLLKIAHSIAWERGQNGYELDEEIQIREQKKIIKTGAKYFEGKKLPICLQEITIHYINRGEGKRKNECFQVGYASDNEFNMYRNIMATECKDSVKNIAEWQTKNGIFDLK